MENVTRDRSYSFAQTRELPRFDASTAAMMSSKDKAALVSMIEESLQAIHDTVRYNLFLAFIFCHAIR
jgi:hypothetical protein